MEREGKEIYRGKERGMERQLLVPGREHRPPVPPSLFLAWQPAGHAGEWAQGCGRAQAGESNVSVMCLSPNQFISYKQHDIRS